jgi:hypothetical protein
MEQRRCILWLVALLLVILPGCGRREEPQTPSQVEKQPPAMKKEGESPAPTPPASAPSVPSAPPVGSGAPEPSPPRPPTAAEAPEFPAFPWPPPQASTSALIDTALLRKAAPERTSLADVDRRLRSALDRTGYYEKKYFSVPDGFALVTRLEQINANGTSKLLPERWAVEVGPLTTFSLATYLRALFRANPGYFRILVFIVTPHLFPESTARVTRPEAMDWFRQGVEALPTAVGQREFSDQGTCTALVYEFEKPDPQGEARMLVPSQLPGYLHLVRAGIWPALGE